MFTRAGKMNFLRGQHDFLERQDDFFQTANQPISVRNLSKPYNKYKYLPHYCEKFPTVSLKNISHFPKFSRIY